MNKKQRILNLLDQGVAPSAIAKIVKTQRTYVYSVSQRRKASAKQAIVAAKTQATPTNPPAFIQTLVTIAQEHLPKFNFTLSVYEGKRRFLITEE
jgi:hypothetical protein